MSSNKNSKPNLIRITVSVKDDDWESIIKIAKEKGWKLNKNAAIVSEIIMEWLEQKPSSEKPQQQIIPFQEMENSKDIWEEIEAIKANSKRLQILIEELQLQIKEISEEKHTSQQKHKNENEIKKPLLGEQREDLESDVKVFNLIKSQSENNSTITREEIIATTGISERTVRRSIERLIKSGKIEKTNTRPVKYKSIF